MSRQSKQTWLRSAIALAVAVAVVAGASIALAQTRGDRGPWNRLDLTKEQRTQVEKIVKEHREASREELHEKLAAVLTEEQMAQLDNMQGRRGGSMWDDRPGRQNRRDFRGPRGERKMQRMGDCRRPCDGPCGKRGDMRRGGMRGGRHGMGMGDMRGRGMRGMDGRGMGRMGEMREERGERMVQHLTVVLDLTPEQQAEIEKIVQDHQEQFKDFDRSRLTFEERQKTREAHRALLANRIKKVLTPEQKEKYDEFMKTMPGPHGGPGRWN